VCLSPQAPPLVFSSKETTFANKKTKVVTAQPLTIYQIPNSNTEPCTEHSNTHTEQMA
jgi:hypothetical protein